MVTDDEIKLIDEYYNDQNKILSDVNLTEVEKGLALRELFDINAWLLSRNDDSYDPYGPQYLFCLLGKKRRGENIE